MNEMSDPWREELGAYLLGALEADEAERVRRHVEQCPGCQAEYAELAPVVGMLAKVPAEAFAADRRTEQAPDPAMWERLRARAGLPAEAAASGAADARFRPAPGTAKPRTGGRPPGTNSPNRPRRRAVRRIHPATAALVSGVLAAVAAFGIYEGTRPASTTPAAAGIETVSASNNADGVTGTVQYRPTDWGSWVQITLKGVKPGDNCVLYAEDGQGNKSVASSWWAPSAVGASATIPGGVNMQSSNIKNFQVITTVGQVLLDIPAS